MLCQVAGQFGVRLLHQSSLLQVQCFDPKEDQWSLRSPAPFLQRCLEAVSLEDTIYVVGGLMSKIFTYDPGSDVWREAADLPSPVVSGAPWQAPALAHSGYGPTPKAIELPG